MSIALVLAGAAAGIGVYLAITGPRSEDGRGPSPAAKTFTMQGSIELVYSYPASIAETSTGGCQGAGGFSDIVSGTAVTVADPHGQTIATGRLKYGLPHTAQVDAPALGMDAQSIIASCTMYFEVPGVPDGLPAYSVTISHRGTQVIDSGRAHSDVLLHLAA